MRVPEQMDPDEFIQKNSPQALANLLENSRISSTEFFIHYLKPENSDNLQAEIAYVEKFLRLLHNRRQLQHKIRILIWWLICCLTLIIIKLSNR